MGFERIVATDGGCKPSCALPNAAGNLAGYATYGLGTIWRCPHCESRWELVDYGSNRGSPSRWKLIEDGSTARVEARERGKLRSTLIVAAVLIPIMVVGGVALLLWAGAR